VSNRPTDQVTIIVAHGLSDGRRGLAGRRPASIISEQHAAARWLMVDNTLVERIGKRVFPDAAISILQWQILGGKA
jgi:hypothetical protein